MMYVGYDYEFGARVALLAELMKISPNKKVRDLQRTALKFYPLQSKEAIRNWMSVRIAFIAADILTKRYCDEDADNFL